MSARLSRTAKLGFIGTAWMSSTPVARLLTSTRSPPMWRANSARSGIVATTLISAAAGARPASSEQAETTIDNDDALHG